MIELVKTTTNDGLRLDGALQLSEQAVADQRLLDGALLLHGVGGNFYGSSLLETLANTLVANGIAALRGNTRGHDGISTAATVTGSRQVGAAFEIVDECRYDVSGWCDFLRQRQLDRLIVIGHSLGAIKALYALAYDPHPAVRAAIVLSPPRLSCAAFLESRERELFQANLKTAQELVEQGRGQTLFPAQFPFPLLIAAEAYVDKYGPQQRYDITRFVARIRCPLLFLYGERELRTDKAAFAGLPEQLASRARPNQVLDLATITGADHFYRGAYDEVTRLVGEWLQAKFRSSD